MTKKILHIGSCDKFLPPFIEFLKDNFNFDEHTFLLTRGMSYDEIPNYNNVKLSGIGRYARFRFYNQVLLEMQKADKIILHGLFDIKIIQILFLSPWLLKKCYWLIWGGDLYLYRIGPHNKKCNVKEFFRRTVIRNMGYLVTSINGDYELAKKWYRAKGEFIHSFYYTTNLFTPLTHKRQTRSAIYILVGNSADPTNQHMEILKKLEKYKNEDIVIYTPLTYGNKGYAEEVIDAGKKLYGSKFKPIINHMNEKDYILFLNQIDIAVFNHNRQQAMGTTRSLLGMGKKVHMNQELSSAITLSNNGIKTFSLEDLNLNYKFPESEKNVDRVRQIYSSKELIRSLSCIFE